MIWKLHNRGVLEPGEVVAPDERLGWGRTIGLGAQHVVAMFGATFVFPVLMGLNPQLAVMMSGVATLVFIFVTQHEVPSYLGSSAAFPGVATAIYASGGKPNDVSGALLCVGLTLLICGIIIQVAGSRVVHKVLPPTVTGAVVMLIGFNLAPVVAKTYWPTDQWTALIVMLLVIALSVGPRGFVSRIAIFLALVIGYLLSWIEDLDLAHCTTPMAALPRGWAGRRSTAPRGSAYLRRRTWTTGNTCLRFTTDLTTHQPMSSDSTCRPSTWPSSCSLCRWSSPSSLRTPATSKRSLK